MVGEDLERGFSVGVVCGLEFQLLDTNFGKEGLHDAKKMAKTDVTVTDNTLNLVELSQVSGIEGLVSEDSVNGEVLHGLEFLLLGQTVKHLRGDGGCVRSQDVLFSLIK